MLAGPLASRVVQLNRSILDILASGVIPSERSILRAETLVHHRVREREFLLDHIPENSIGVEIGVFTGLFSSILARDPKIARVTFVDPWWKAFGERYPDWGDYTDRGRVATHSSYELARRRANPTGASTGCISTPPTPMTVRNESWRYWIEKSKKMEL
jgi:hypothetical protein